jgi:hypothetical protein
MSADQVPVGTIIAYAADEVTHLLSEGWSLCNGVSISKDSYPELFNAIGYSNGRIGDNFLLPELQGRFLRGKPPACFIILSLARIYFQIYFSGADTKNPPGNVADFTTANRGFKVSIKNIPYTSHDTDAGATGSAAWHMDDWNGDSQKFTVNGGDSETRPVNIYFQFLIKMTSAISGTPVSIPTGSVIPYAASDLSKVNPDPSWLPCDGNKYRVREYADLAQVLGGRFSTSIGEIFFNVPIL